MLRRGRRAGQSAGSQLQKLLPVLPGVRVAEAVPPERLRLGRPGDPQEPLDQRPVVEHERHERPVLDGGGELSADRRKGRFKNRPGSYSSCVYEQLPSETRPWITS